MLLLLLRGFLGVPELLYRGFRSFFRVGLVLPLTKWRKYPELAGGRMKAELQRVLAKPGLSKDVYEIVNKSLA